MVTGPGGEGSPGPWLKDHLSQKTHTWLQLKVKGHERRFIDELPSLRGTASVSLSDYSTTAAAHVKARLTDL